MGKLPVSVVYRRAARLGLAVSSVLGALALGSVAPGEAGAAGTNLISETFVNSNVASPASWIKPTSPVSSNLACLTAGTATSQAPIPDCSNPEVNSSGSGALRFTKATKSEEGGVLTTSSVPASTGIDASFDSYQYGGTGADGIAFVMAAVNPTSPTAPANIGQPGGDLGYAPGSTSGSRSTGLAYGYLGVGLDVYGNYSNPPFDGSGCTNPSWAGENPGQVTVRGPGNGTSGYCLLNSSLSGHPGTTQKLSGSSSSTRSQSQVPVEVLFNTTGSAVDMTTGGFTADSVPAGDYGVAWTPIGGTAQFLDGPLPTVANGGIPANLYPSGWLNPVTGIPYQIGFGWVASTGSSTDIHEVNNAVVNSLQSTPVLTAAITDDQGHQFPLGGNVNFTLTGGVTAGVDETDPIAMTTTLPAGLTPGSASGAGWTCVTSGQTVTCTETGTVTAGTTLPPVTLPATVAAGASTAPDALDTTLVVSSNDGDPADATDQGTGLGAIAQTITFTSSPPADAVAGGTTYTPMATGGGSGNPVVFSIDPSTTNGSCTILAGVISFAHAGTCVIDANQNGGVNGGLTYTAAPEVAQSFTVNPSTASTLVFLSQPGDFTAGGSSPSFEVAVEDSFGDVVTTSSDTVELTPTPGAAFTGASEPAVNGIATFDLLSTATPDTYVVTANDVTDGSLTPASSDPFTVSAGSASQLVFLTQPQDFTAGGSSPSFEVAIEDSFGNVVTTSSDTVELTPTPGASFTGTSEAAVNGVATFAALSTDTAGTYTVTASDTTDGSLTPASSDPFTVSAGSASQLAFLTQPGDFTADGSSPSFEVAIEDSFGNVVTSSSDTISLTPTPGAVFTGTSEAAVNGIATFALLSTATPNTYVVTANDVTDGSLTPASSDPFTVSAASASQLAFLTQPGDFTAGGSSPSFEVAIEDSFGNVVTTDSDTIALTPTPGAVFTGTSQSAVNGIATFASLSTDTAGTYTVTASDTTDGSLIPASSDPFTVSAASASQLAFLTQPGDFTAGGSSPSFEVAVEDSFGNVVTTDSDTISLTPTPGAVFTGTSQSAVNGIATFASLSTDTAGTYTVTASDTTDGSLTPASSGPFTVSAASASQLAFLTQPGDFTAGGSSPSFEVAIEDSFGNVATTSSDTIALTPTPGASFTGTSQSAVNGIATFASLSTDTAGTYTVTASDTTDGSLTQATSDQFTVSAASASQLAFLTQPGDFTADGSSPSFEVAIEDSFGNVVTSSSDTISLTPTPGAVFTGTSEAAVNGIATFALLSTATPDTYVVTANDVTDGSLTPASSDPFTVSAASASQLAFLTQPGAFIAGGSSPSFEVAIEDSFGNVVTTDSDTIALTPTPGASFTGTSQSAVNGIATFASLSTDTAGTYTVTASDTTDGSLTPASSDPFTVSAASASQLAFLTQPGDFTAGGSSPSFEVAIEDSFGNVVTTDSDTISLAPTPGAVFTGTSQSAVNGIATFASLSTDTAGTYTVTASDTTDGSLTPASSGPFTVSAASASQLTFLTQPQDFTAGGSSPSFEVAIEDSFGNVVTTDSDTISLTPTPGAVFTGTSQSAVDGIATFASLSTDTAGTYTVTASDTTDGSLTPASSGPFTVSAASASQLAFLTQPGDFAADGSSPSFEVAIEDSFGNVVTSSSDTISLTPTPGAVFTGTSEAAVNGIATFALLSTATPDTYVVTANDVTDGSLTPASSDPFTVSAASASQLAFLTQPGDFIAGGSSPSFEVAIEDSFGNVVTTDSDTITLTSTPGAVFTGTSQSAVNGIATFASLSTDTAGTYTVTANDVTDGSLTPASSDPFTVSAASASQLAFLTQPGDFTAGGSSPSFEVAIEDSFGNVVTTDSDTISLTPTPGAVFTGTSEAAVNGIATFALLSTATPDTYLVTANDVTDGSLTPASSDPFTVSAASASQLAFLTQPGDFTADGSSPSFEVAIEDSFGNVVTSSSDTISLTPTPGAVFTGTSEAAVNGIATFALLSTATPDTYVVTANDVTDGSLTPASSDPFTVSAASASQLAFLTQPGAFIAGGSSPSFEVAIEDSFGNVVTTDSDTIALTPTPGASFTGTSQSAVNGIATFASLSTDTAGTYTVTASDTTDGSLTQATSDQFTVSAASASQLAFLTQPGDFTAGGSSPSFEVAIEDSFGNVVTTSSDTISLTPTPGAVFTGTSQSAVNGIATFASLSTDTAGTYTVTASDTTDGSLTPASSGPFTVSAASASQLAFLTQPGDFTAGGSSPSFEVAIEDSFGNVATTSSDTISLNSTPGAIFTGTSEAAVNGIATFTLLSTATPNTYILTANDITNGAPVPASSDPFTVSAASASQLAFLTQPQDFTAGGSSPSFEVAIEDSFGNVVTTDSDAITLTPTPTPASAFTGTSQSAVDGIATFAVLSTTQAGTYTVTAADTDNGSLTQATSDQFTVSAATATKLAFLTQPQDFTAGGSSPSFEVAIEDSFGNVVTTDSDTIALTPTPTPASVFTGTSQSAVDGIATFAALSTTQAGTYTVTAADTDNGAITQATSAAFVVTATGDAYYPLTPTRICDTRAGNPSGLSGEQGQCNGSGGAGERLSAGSPLDVTVSPDFGVPADAIAAVLNVTAVNGSAQGYMTVYPAGQPAPTASNLNFKAGAVVPNLTEVGIGSGGQVAVVSNVDVDVVIDLEGYVAPSTDGSGLYHPLATPARICDTRTGNPSQLSGSVSQCNAKPLSTDTPYTVQVTGLGGVPATGVEAVVLNVTVVDPTAQGFLTVYPAGEPTPTASNLNYLVPSQNLANRVMVPVSAGGAIALYANQSTDAVVDVSGWFTTPGGTGDSFTPLPTPVRICDTRAGNPSGLSGSEAQCNGGGSGSTLGPDSSRTIQVSGLAGVPSGATAVVLNLTAVDPTQHTYLTVYPTDPRPLVSDLNPPPGSGSRRANLVVATLSPSGTVTIYNYAGSVDVVVDVSGWY